MRGVAAGSVAELVSATPFTTARCVAGLASATIQAMKRAISIAVLLVSACTSSGGAASNPGSPTVRAVEVEDAPQSPPAQPAAAENDVPATPEGGAKAPPASEEELAKALSLPDDVPPLDSPCATRSEFASHRLDAALRAAAQGCETDDDCGTVNGSTDCFGACPKSVLAQHAKAFESFRLSLDERVCAGYRDGGCAYATPRCINGVAQCIDGSCKWGRK